MIFRLESKIEYIGVYRYLPIDQLTNKYLAHCSKGPERHPMPYADTLLLQAIHKDFHGEWYNWIDEFVFGFSNPEQLFRWFYNETDLRIMGKRGVIVSVYEPPNEYHGHTQACFPKWYHTLWNPTKRYTIPQFLRKFGSKKELTTDTQSV